MTIEIDKLSVSYGTNLVLDHISFQGKAGDCIAVLGPNGVGKSTLFRSILGFLKPQCGTVLIGEKDITSLSRTDAAKEIAYIPQFAEPIFNYTVLDTVLMGVMNQLPMMKGPQKNHYEKAISILEELGISHLCHRGSGKISGGERQLTLLARALIQDAKVLIMDEPTANLDYGNRSRVMNQIRQLGKNGYTIIFSTHEPNQAFHYASKVIGLKGGKILTEGEPKEVLTGDVLSDLYGIPVYVGTMTAGEQEYYISLPFENMRAERQPD